MDWVTTTEYRILAGPAFSVRFELMVDAKEYFKYLMDSLPNYEACAEMNAWLDDRNWP